MSSGEEVEGGETMEKRSSEIEVGATQVGSSSVSYFSSAPNLHNPRS
jgi:hypothetical protein